MKKIILTISLAGLILMNFSSAFAQKLPTDLIKKYPQYEKYPFALTEEVYGPHTGLPEEYQNLTFYRKSKCDVEPSTNQLRCVVEPYLQTECTPTNTLSSNATTGASSGEQIICDDVGIVIGTGGLEILKNFITMIYVWAAGVIGLVAVFRIVVAGVEISTSMGGGRQDNARNAIISSLAGLVLLFTSAAILYTVNPNFFT